MDLFEVKPADLLNAWRDAVRAAELADRLAASAVKATEDANERSVASEELAALAEQAAEHATRCAERARDAATRAAALAKSMNEVGVPEAERIVRAAHSVEAEARTAYHDAETERRGDAQSN